MVHSAVGDGEGALAQHLNVGQIPTAHQMNACCLDRCAQDIVRRTSAFECGVESSKGQNTIEHEHRSQHRETAFIELFSVCNAFPSVCRANMKTLRRKGDKTYLGVSELPAAGTERPSERQQSPSPSSTLSLR